MRAGSIIFEDDCDFNTGDFLMTDNTGLIVLTASYSLGVLLESVEKRSW
mgnify:FL=1